MRRQRRGVPAGRDRALAGLYRSGGVAPIYDRWLGAFSKPSTALQAMYLLNGLPE